jgi:PAS domain S-box-containing protein
MIIANAEQNRFKILDISERSFLVKIFATIIGTLIATFLKLSFKGYLGEGAPFLLFFIVILYCGRFVGFWYATFCTLACGVIGYINFMPLPGKFDPESIVKLLVFVAEGLCIAAFSNGFRKNLKATTTANDNFKLLISKSNDGLARISKEGKILFATPSVETITGYTKTDLESKGFDIFPDESDRGEVAMQFLKVLSQQGTAATFTHRYKNAKGEIRWMETVFTNHLNVKGIDAIVANFRDVTDKVEAEIRKNDFIGIAAHEIKNPFAVIKLNLGLINDAIEKENLSLIKNINEPITRNIDKIVRLLDELMDFSSFEASLNHLHLSLFNIDVAIKNAITIFKGSYKNEIVVTGNTTIKIYGDRLRIEQVLINLLSNASKYSNEHSVITIECNTNKKYLTIAVIDTGMGIEEKEQSQLFNKFHRVKTSHNKTKGYGLGLYICSEIIKAHKGVIGVQSKVGKGSRFWFSLPLDTSNEN